MLVHFDTTTRDATSIWDQESQASDQEGVSPLNNESAWQQSLFDIEGTFLIAAIANIANKIFNSPYLETTAAGTTALFITTLARKALDGYSFIQISEEYAFLLTCYVPHIQLIALIIACVVAPYFLSIGVLLAIFSGILTGLTRKIEMLELLAEIRPVDPTNR